MVARRIGSLMLTVVLLLAATPLAAAAHHYVSPWGSPGGDGSRNRPWDLTTAFAHPPQVQGGDTIWLRGGRYFLRETLVSSLTGTPEQPIIVRQMPGRRATLDCRLVIMAQPGSDCLNIVGSHTWYWGFEIMNSSPVRWTDTPGSKPNLRGRGIHSQAGPGTKLINLVIHDLGTALFESQRSGIEIAGNLVYNGGWDAPDRSHGPGFYIRNRSSSPPKLLRENVIFQNFRQGIQGFGSFDNVFSNFVLEGNVLFNNGAGQDGPHRNIMFGNDNTNHVNNTVRNNYTYYSWGWGGGENMFASPAGGCRGLRLLGNVFSHGPGRVAVEINHCEEVLAEGNLFSGSTSLSAPGQDVPAARAAFREQFPSNDYYGDDLPDPSGTRIFLRPNPYEPRRAHLIVYNWDRLATVEVDLASLPIAPGDRYEVRSVQNYFGKRIRGVYRGAPLQLSMTKWPVAPPIGYEDRALPPALPEFGVFVVTWETPSHRIRAGALLRRGFFQEEE